MKEFIFLTDEGFTFSPKNQHIENLQVVGFIKSDSWENAIDNFVFENGSIFDYGFTRDNLICYEINR
jgi:hypothetical protein